MSNTVDRRRVILDLAVTLDGFIEGKNGEVDWCIMDPDMGFMDFLDGIDTILYGRTSYEMWGQYSPKPEDSDADHELWNQVHSKAKYVFSRTPRTSDHRATWIHDHIAEEVERLRNQPGQDIWLYGGASLITTFVNLGLVNEFRLSVHPVILGEGKPMFIDIGQRVNLTTVQTRTFASGVVQLIYHCNSN
ncbi:dihydrofolate reductase [Paenibacillus phyllosphaerae]|uniref:Dihydrofolate reductase n=1 Tax=Paenibacillus phyllosphaerae TaxID=274593 RepID=A0A7W5AU49_9BACL|nr:dihydrofolate reductase family protein [Paenibacillus phyllosphaerae]MBB3108830.1 dihydrofolate reductase [Paenibacillus phyllosphaerae]